MNAPSPISGPSREETERFIAEATGRLKGPLSNGERALVVADRKDARAHLAKIKAAGSLRCPTAGREG